MGRKPTKSKGLKKLNNKQLLKVGHILTDDNEPGFIVVNGHKVAVADYRANPSKYNQLLPNEGHITDEEKERYLKNFDKALKARKK